MTQPNERNSPAIPTLLRWNDFPGLTAPPTLEHSSPRNVNLADVAAYLRVLAGGDLLTPDVTLERFLRSLVPGMPTEVDEAAWEEARERRAEVEEQGREGVEEEDDNEEKEEESKRKHARFFRLRAGRHTYAYGEKPAPAERPAAYRVLADGHAAAQRAGLESWSEGMAGELAELPPDTSESELLAKLDDYVLAGLLMFRERSMLDIAAAFWLGFGAPSGPPEALQALQAEIALADSWIGYGPGGTLARTNPIGKGTLFGDVAGQLEGQIAAILLLLKQGRQDEVAGLVADAVKAATQGYYRAEHYAGHVWRGIWVGALERRKAEDNDGPVRWVLDPLAHHCHECPIYGADPPGREYPSMGELLRATGGTLPGFGTECDGECRCHLEERGEDGGWRWV